MIEASTPAVSTPAVVPISVKSVHATAEVYEMDPLNDLRWAPFLDGHPRASVFHSSKWLKALHTAYGYEPMAITTCSPGTPLTNGLVFCRINSCLTGRRVVSLPFSDHCEPLVHQSDELDDMLRLMKRPVDEGGCKHIEIRPISYEPGSQTGMRLSGTYCFHRLDLRPSAQELFRRFHKDCVQRKIRRAERENLMYEDGNSEDLLQTFFRLLVMTRRRHYVPPPPLSWFRALIAAFGKDLKIRSVSKNGVAVASILTLSHKKTMVYKYGCSDAAANKVGGMALLFWRTIQEAQENGLEEFDMGRSDADNPGLIAFKEHWGADGSLLNYWTYPYIPTRYPSNWQKSLLRRAVSVAPDLALKIAGTLAYRHIG